MNGRVFVNLSAGAEWQPWLVSRGVAIAFSRIQSTALEQKRFEHVLLTLGAEFMVAAATGPITVYDCGARKDVPRSLHQGLPWIRYALTRAWFGREEQATVRGHNVTAYFNEQYAHLRPALAEMKYYRKMLTVPAVTLGGVSCACGSAPIV